MSNELETKTHNHILMRGAEFLKRVHREKNLFRYHGLRYKIVFSSSCSIYKILLEDGKSVLSLRLAPSPRVGGHVVYVNFSVLPE